ncbi:unnamed protein product [Lampetra fluviatilis]
MSGNATTSPAAGGTLYILNHPKYKELLDLKVAEESEAFTTLVVYLDLLEETNLKARDPPSRCCDDDRSLRDGLHPLRRAARMRDVVRLTATGGQNEIRGEIYSYGRHVFAVRCWTEVNTAASHELGLLYVTGRPAAGKPLTVVLPVSSQASVSHCRIHEIMKHTCVGTEPASVTLAIAESDSTVVYYRLTDGLVTPEPPDCVEDMDNKQWRRRRRRQQR